MTLNYGLPVRRGATPSRTRTRSARASTWSGQPTPTTTVHAGYARYFTPPPFELISIDDRRQVRRHDGGRRGHAELARCKAERANYFDVGVDQQILPGLKVGLDAYYKLPTTSRRGPVRRADHPDAVQLPHRPQHRRRAHDLLCPRGVLLLRQSRRSPSRRPKGIASAQFNLLARRARLHRQPSPSTPITTSSSPRPPASPISGRHALQRRHPGRQRAAPGQRLRPQRRRSLPSYEQVESRRLPPLRARCPARPLEVRFDRHQCVRRDLRDPRRHRRRRRRAAVRPARAVFFGGSARRVLTWQLEGARDSRSALGGVTRSIRSRLAVSRRVSS